MATQFDLTIKSVSASGAANLRGKDPKIVAEELKTYLQGLASTMSENLLRSISEDIAEEAAKVAARRLQTATFLLLKNFAGVLAGTGPDKSNRTVVLTSRSSYGVFQSRTTWEGLTERSLAKKRRRGAPPIFFVDTGLLAQGLQGDLVAKFQRYLPKISYTIKRVADVKRGSGTDKKYEVIIRTSRSPLAAYGLGSGLTSQSGARDRQARLLEKLGFDDSGGVFKKLQGPGGNFFRPTLLLLVQHWYTFVLPKELAASVTEAANRIKQKGTTGRGYGGQNT